MYSYDKNFNSKCDIESLKAFAKKHRLRIISVGFFHKWVNKNINANPDELVSYFKNASFVITDTFHGAVLSLITNTNFAVRINNNSNKLLHLLKQYSADDRIVKTLNTDTLEYVFSHNPDFNGINKAISNHVDFSADYLKKAFYKYDKQKW